MSSSNLNDIASALEKLNITDEQIAAIKQNLTDVTGYDNIQQGLGQLISVLATARSQDIESVNEKISKLKVVTGSYTGNGTLNLTINYGESGQLRLLIIIQNNNVHTTHALNSYGIIIENHCNATSYVSGDSVTYEFIQVYNVTGGTSGNVQVNVTGYMMYNYQYPINEASTSYTYFAVIY